MNSTGTSACPVAAIPITASGQLRLLAKSLASVNRFTTSKNSSLVFGFEP
jgi:hypothetical protein